MHRLITAAQVDEGLQSAAILVAGASAMFAKWARGFQPHANTLPLFDQKTSDNAGGDPNIRYYHSYWRLQPGLLLRIRFTPPPGRMWNFQLNNHWMESLDYRYYTIHVNSKSAKYKSDGSFRIIVTHQDPNAGAGGFKGNWIQTADHLFGTMCFRWVNPSVPDETLPHPVAKLVKFASL